MTYVIFNICIVTTGLLEYVQVKAVKKLKEVMIAIYQIVKGGWKWGTLNL